MHLASVRRLKWPPFARLPASSSSSCSSCSCSCSCSQLLAVSCCPAICVVLSGLASLTIPTQSVSSFETFTVYFTTAPSAPSSPSPPSAPPALPPAPFRYRPCAALYLNYCNDLHWSGCCNILGTVSSSQTWDLAIGNELSREGCLSKGSIPPPLPAPLPLCWSLVFRLALLDLMSSKHFHAHF